MYANALTTATSLDTKIATTAEINTSAETLENATSALVTQADYDKTVAIARLNTAINAKVEDKTIYTVATWSGYANALSTATSLDTKSATTAEINTSAENT